MKEWKILPVFTTGPSLEFTTDRTKIINHFHENGLKHFEPDNLATIVKESKSRSYIAKYCLRNSFPFEQLLSNIALFNVQLPISQSSIYELGQFHMNNTNKTIFLPKYKIFSSDLGTNKTTKTCLNYYIDLNHEIDYKYYSAIKKDSFPVADEEGLKKKINTLIKVIKNKEILVNQRVLGKGDKFNRNIFTHVIKNKEDGFVFVPMKIMYIFALTFLKDIEQENILKKENFFVTLKEIIAKFYSIDVKRIVFYYDMFKISKKIISYGMYLIAHETNAFLKIDDLVAANGTTEIIRFRNRKIEVYKKTSYGDERRRKDKKILAILNEKFSSSNISHAYIYDKNWITNVSSHSKTLFNPKNERRIVLKTDVKSFFDNIDWEILKTKLHKIGAYREGMPESTLPGLVLSPIYSNIYMHEFDMRMEKFCKDNNLMISRYSDDIFVTTTHKTPKNFEMSEALAHIKTLLKELKLEINDKKTKIVNLAHESIKITGIMVNNNYLSLPKRHSDMIAAWYRKPHKYGLTIKYIDNYIKELNKRKIRFRIKQ